MQQRFFQVAVPKGLKRLGKVGKGWVLVVLTRNKIMHTSQILIETLEKS